MEAKETLEAETGMTQFAHMCFTHGGACWVCVIIVLKAHGCLHGCPEMQHL